MLQKTKPEDYVIATGKTYSVRDFVNTAFEVFNKKIEWRGKGLDEVGIDIDSGKKVIKISKEYFRPSEVEVLLGDSSKAQRDLGWKAKISFKDMVKEMVLSDHEKVKNNEIFI
jgi:GDPmannose 4,6-dehydratase